MVSVVIATVVAGGLVILLTRGAPQVDQPETAGFALWPVDTPEEAQTECARAEPWRYSAKETATRFAQQVLFLDRPKIGMGSMVGDGSDSFDIMGKGVSLYNYAYIRRAYGCWYVTSILNREGYPAASPGYAGEGDERVMFVHIPTRIDDGPERYVLKVGNGEEFTTLEESELDPDATTTLVTVPAPRSEPGHYFFGPIGNYGVVDPPEGSTIPPPPDLEQMVDIPGLARSRSLLERWVEERGRCGGWWSEFGRLHATRQTIVDINLRVPKKLHRETTELPNGDFRVVTGGREVYVDFWELAKGCTALGQIRTVDSGAERVQRVRVSDEAFAFDIRWGRATDIYLEYSFGEAGGNATVSKIANPIMFPIGGPDPRRKSGTYSVIFLRNGKFLSMESAALPTLEQIVELST